MPFYLAWIYSNFSRWNFKFFSNSDLSYGTNQNFMPFIQAQFFVAQYPQRLHSALVVFKIPKLNSKYNKQNLCVEKILNSKNFTFGIQISHEKFVHKVPVPHSKVPIKSLYGQAHISIFTLCGVLLKNAILHEKGRVSFLCRHICISFM